MGVCVDRVPPWLPDWRDATAYPTPDDAKKYSAIWAWEFLRRNETYRADFEFSRNGPEIEARAAIEWRLCRMVDPAIAWNDSRCAKRVEFVRTTQTIVHPYPPGATSQQRTRSIVKLEPYEVAVVFDLRRPIEEQTTDAKALLIKARNHKVSARIVTTIPGAKLSLRKLPIYLRCLDAVARLQPIAKAKLDLREAFYRGKTGGSGAESVREDIERGRYYRDTGYHDLVRQDTGK